MYKKTVRYIYDFYFRIFKINNFQSLKYQIMIYLMHFHQLKRLGIIEEFSYVGTNILYVTKEDWRYLYTEISKNISKNYKILYKDYTEEDKEVFFYDIIIEDINNSNYQVNLSLEEDYFLEIVLTDVGYSYQYNGYKKSEVKMQEKANYFAIATLFGTSFAWLESKKYFDLRENITEVLAVYFLIFLGYSLRKKEWIYNVIILLVILKIIFL